MRRGWRVSDIFQRRRARWRGGCSRWHVMSRARWKRRKHVRGNISAGLLYSKMKPTGLGAMSISS